jgi:uncharacterized protein (TIGR02147 family)
MKDTQPKIYHYDDPILYLQDMIVFLKKTKKAFSYRYFTKKAGFSSPSALKLILDRKRGMTDKSAEKISKGLEHTSLDSEYFLELVRFTQEKNHEKKKEYYDRCIQIRKKKKIHSLSSDQFSYFSTWYHPAVRELVKHKNFNGDPSWIAQKIYPPITLRQASQSLELLLSLGLIKRDGRGSFVQSDRAISTERELKSMVVRQFHITMGEKAIESLKNIDPEMRDMSGITFGIPNYKIQELKDRIAQMRKDLTSTIGSMDESTDDVYHLNIQLFPLTKKDDEDEE